MKADFFHVVVVRFWYFWLIIFGTVIIKFLFRRYKPVIKGAAGEVWFGFMSFICLGKDYHIFKNIVIPAYDGTTQIDQLVVSKYGIFVIEIKNYKGRISGGERESKWTQSFFRQKYGFQNPLLQNYKHIKSLQTLTGLPEDKFQSLIVFSGRAVFETPMPPNITRGIDYLIYIKLFDEPVLTEDEIGHVIRTVSEKRLSAAAHRRYIRERFKDKP